ncbi:MAG: hypothetical protein RL518_1739 [Pseudomonadota bacterium]|jgi:hypothetical protein
MSNLKISKNWVLGRREMEFEGTLALQPGALSEIIDGCLRQVTPMVHKGPQSRDLLDLKGRDPHETLLPGIAAARVDELFRVGGVVAVAQKGPDFEWEPFEVVCYSPFNRFEGTHHIVHTTETERAGGLPSWLPTHLIGMAAPIKPRFFRYGLEHFKSMLTFASLGYAPQVTTTFLVDCVADTLAFKVTHEFKKAIEADPFERIPAYRSLANVIEAATGTNLQSELQAELAQRL